MALLAGGERRLGAYQVDRPAVDRRHEVRPERAAARVELLGVVPEAEEHLLDDLLGERVVVEHPHREAERGVAVAAEHLGQRLLSEAGDGDHQGRVARVSQVLLPGEPRLRLGAPWRIVAKLRCD